MSTFDSILITMANISYYVAIGLHFLVLLLIMNRLISAKIKKIIDMLQVVGLIAYYRYVQEEVATRGLKVANAFNFNYLSLLICDEHTAQYGCSSYQNLIGPGLTFLLFILLFFLSFIIAKIVYYVNSNEDSIVYIRKGR